jgi:DNA-binding PucR family transcriptional regulator
MLVPATRSSTRRRPSHARTVRRLERATGQLAGAALAEMDAKHPWYREMNADTRSWIGLVTQAGIAAFATWCKNPVPEEAPALTANVFATAPPIMARSVTLQQTVELVRVTIDAVESHIDELAAPGEADWLRHSILLYSRELAFAAAAVYARAAEERGAWDARLEALVVDAVLRGEADEAVRSRAAALGWRHGGAVVVVVGAAPEGEPEPTAESVHRAARAADFDVLVGVQGDRLVTVLGGVEDPLVAGRSIMAEFGPGAVVVGPPVPDLLSATQSATAALAGLRAAAAWQDAPRPVSSEELLPERALSGDGSARRQLLEDVYKPLVDAGPVLLETLAVFLEQASSLEATARLLFVHPNTVRYRLRRVADATGFTATEARDAFTLKIALAIGRLAQNGVAL